jgi:hypothetical protein
MEKQKDGKLTRDAHFAIENAAAFMLAHPAYVREKILRRTL